MADKQDPIDVMNAGMDRAMDDLRGVWDKQVEETDRPLFGKPNTKQERLAEFTRVFARPELVSSRQDELSQRHSLPKDKPISRRLATDLIAAWQEMREEEDDDGNTA